MYPTTASQGVVGAPLNCDTTISTCSVTFPETYTTETGSYWLYLQYGTVSVDTDILVSTLVVTGDSTIRSNPNILKQTIVTGPHRYHRIYSTTPKTLSITGIATDDLQYNMFINIPFVRVFLEKTDVQGY